MIHITVQRRRAETPENFQPITAQYKKSEFVCDITV